MSAAKELLFVVAICSIPALFFPGITVLFSAIKKESHKQLNKKLYELRQN